MPKMHKIRFRLAVRPRRRWESSQHPQTLQPDLRGPATSKGRGGGERKRWEEDRALGREEGEWGEERDGEGGDRQPAHFSLPFSAWPLLCYSLCESQTIYGVLSSGYSILIIIISASFDRTMALVYGRVLDSRYSMCRRMSCNRIACVTSCVQNQFADNTLYSVEQLLHRCLAAQRNAE